MYLSETRSSPVRGICGDPGPSASVAESRGAPRRRMPAAGLLPPRLRHACHAAARCFAAGVACLVAACASAPPFPATSPADFDHAALAAKAEAFEAAILDRHLAPEGVVLYRIDLRTIREDLANGSYPDSSDVPMFTGLLAATACTRADATAGAEREAALALAERALDGLRALMDVTGVEGLMARNLRKGPIPDDDDPDHRWFQGAGDYRGYAWRGDVSMDQYANGLLPAVAECREHFPDRVRPMIAAAARGLLDREMHLIDPDGRKTTFGDLSASSGFGLNSIAKLTGYGVVALAAELTGESAFVRERDRLRDDEGVVRSSTITNLRVFGITNFSNDMMAWNLYRVLVPMARRTSDPALTDLERGVSRAWERVADDRNAYYTAVYCQLRPEACTAPLRASILDVLARFPLEKRPLESPAALADVPRAWLPGRKWTRRAAEIVPIELRPVSSLEWKSSPYRIEPRVAPFTQYTGLDYLMVYWLDRRSSLRSD
jgi:hypothetical protein